MTQFIARAFASKDGFRVVVDGITHFDVATESDIEPGARKAILLWVNASYPRRAEPEPWPGVVKTQTFDLELVETSCGARSVTGVRGPHRPTRSAGGGGKGFVAPVGRTYAGTSSPSDTTGASAGRSTGTRKV